MSLNNFIATMTANGGMSFANNFVVKFVDPPVPIPGVVTGTNNIFELLCDEAQLPNSSSATGTLKGRYLGEGQVNYPHTRIFSEFQLGFQCDANMIPLKFLQDWYGFIYNEQPSVYTSESLSAQQTKGIPNANRTNRLQYPDSYCRTIMVSKTEIGGNSSVERAPITFRLERAWPFAIDATPLQFGSSQITKVTAQFYYTRHTVITNDISNSPAYKKAG